MKVFAQQNQKRKTITRRKIDVWVEENGKRLEYKELC